MKKSDVVQLILQDKFTTPQRENSEVFAPTNIALCKYWGKRNTELNLPVTSSLSIALPEKGAITKLSLHDASDDLVILNNKELPSNSKFVTRLRDYLDLFRSHHGWRLKVEIQMNIPVAAGLASSACGFAALISALNNLFDWQLSLTELSILARLGSGSASRSLWNGFVEWQAGEQPDGMDSYAKPLDYHWPELRVGILPITDAEKPVSSREAMQRTVETSMMYANWPEKVELDMEVLKKALEIKNFSLLGSASESNALAMHATMLSSWPPICYSLPETIAAMHQAWNLRRDGVEVYFTQDAGPNLKLLFLDKDEEDIREKFSHVQVIRVN